MLFLLFPKENKVFRSVGQLGSQPAAWPAGWSGHAILLKSLFYWLFLLFPLVFGVLLTEPLLFLLFPEENNVLWPVGQLGSQPAAWPADWSGHAILLNSLFYLLFLLFP